MREDCKTMAHVLAGIRTPEELEAVLAVIADPAIPTKPMTSQDWSTVADLKRRMGVKG